MLHEVINTPACKISTQHKMSDENSMSPYARTALSDPPSGLGPAGPCHPSPGGTEKYGGCWNTERTHGDTCTSGNDNHPDSTQNRPYALRLFHALGRCPAPLSNSSQLASCVTLMSIAGCTGRTVPLPKRRTQQRPLSLWPCAMNITAYRDWSIQDQSAPTACWRNYCTPAIPCHPTSEPPAPSASDMPSTDAFALGHNGDISAEALHPTQEIRDLSPAPRGVGPSGRDPVDELLVG